MEAKIISLVETVEMLDKLDIRLCLSVWTLLW